MYRKRTKARAAVDCFVFRGHVENEGPANVVILVSCPSKKSSLYFEIKVENAVWSGVVCFSLLYYGHMNSCYYTPLWLETCSRWGYRCDVGCKMCWGDIPERIFHLDEFATLGSCPYCGQFLPSFPCLKSYRLFLFCFWSSVCMMEDVPWMFCCE